MPRIDEIDTITSVQGGIGYGKSKYMSALKRVVAKQGLCAFSPSSNSGNPPPNGEDRFLLIDEPDFDWTKKNCSLLNCRGEGTDKEMYAILDLFYKGMKSATLLNPYATPFQSRAYVSRLEYFLETLAKLPKHDLASNIHVHIIAERTMRTDRLFYKNVYDSGSVSQYEWESYERNFAVACSDTVSRENLMVRINTSTKKAYQRYKQRDRKAETDNDIPIEYFQSLEKPHEEMYADFAKEKGKDSVISVDFERDMTDDEIDRLAEDLITHIKNLRLQEVL